MRTPVNQPREEHDSMPSTMATISVCMAVRNGARFLREQIDSILSQLGPYDELVISDDHSTDNSIEVAESFRDSRIRIIRSERRGIVPAFEAALLSARGTYIFLADQDDIWAPNKVEVMLRHLGQHDLVVSDCVIVDEKLETVEPSFHRLHRSSKGLIRNLIRNSYMGCCMAFRKGLLRSALPFPVDIPLHDSWIGLVSELYFRSVFIPDRLVYYRRHQSNASSTSASTNRSVTGRIMDRILLIKNLIKLTYAK